jgi:hypothetical protein
MFYDLERCAVRDNTVFCTNCSFLDLDTIYLKEHNSCAFGRVTCLYASLPQTLNVSVYNIIQKHTLCRYCIKYGY